MMSQRNETLFESHGVSPEHTHEQAIALGNAMLIALGAGGPLSAEEMDAFVSIAKGYGATPEAIDGWRRFDPASGKIADHIQLTPRLARHMLYEAVRICGAGAPSAPVAKLAGVAGALGAEPGVRETLEAVVMAEASMQEARATLAATEAEPKTPSGSTKAAFAAIDETAAGMKRLRLAMMETGKPAG